jgi:hypothetical protein
VPLDGHFARVTQEALEVLNDRVYHSVRRLKKKTTRKKTFSGLVHPRESLAAAPLLGLGW